MALRALPPLLFGFALPFAISACPFSHLPLYFVAFVLPCLPAPVHEHGALAPLPGQEPAAFPPPAWHPALSQRTVKYGGFRIARNSVWSACGSEQQTTFLLTDATGEPVKVFPYGN